LIRRYSTAFLIAVAVLVADLLTKRYAAIHLADADVVLIPGWLWLTFVENPGAAFGILQGSGPLVGVAAILVTTIVIGLLAAERPFIELAAFGLIIGGAIGNIVDRIFRGEGFLDGPVIDWIGLWRIPTFNIADAAVNVAVVLLLIHAWRHKNPTETTVASTS
jgi:signal peptidase II